MTYRVRKCGTDKNATVGTAATVKSSQVIPVPIITGISQSFASTAAFLFLYQGRP